MVVVVVGAGRAGSANAIRIGWNSVSLRSGDRSCSSRFEHTRSIDEPFRSNFFHSRKPPAPTPAPTAAPDSSGGAGGNADVARPNQTHSAAPYTAPPHK